MATTCLPGRGAVGLGVSLASVFLLAALVSAGCSSPVEQPRPHSEAAPAVIPEDRFKACLETYAGRYTAETPLESHRRAVRRQALRLSRDWNATLTTEFLHTRHKPIIETGTWRCDGTLAHVLLTSSSKGPERDEFAFQFQNGWLIATSYDRKRHGTQGIRLRKD